MTDETPEKEWIRAADAAELLNVDTNTLRRWTREGRGPAHKRTGERGFHVAYDKAAVLDYRRQYGPFLRGKRTKEAS